MPRAALVSRNRLESHPLENFVIGAFDENACLIGIACQASFRGYRDPPRTA